MQLLGLYAAISPRRNPIQQPAQEISMCHALPTHHCTSAWPRTLTQSRAHWLSRAKALTDSRKTSRAIRIAWHKAIHLGQLQQRTHAFIHAAQPDRPTLLLDHAIHIHQRPQPCAIDTRASRHIRHQLAHAILHQLLQLRVHNLLGRAQRQRTTHRNDRGRRINPVNHCL